MNIKNIKMILRAVELKSLSKAAEEFSYTPSAFSHMADALEEEIGCKILKRTHKGVELTANGQLLIQDLRDITRSEQRLFDAINRLYSDKNQLIIGAYASISKFILPKLLKGFKEKYPQIRVSIVIADNFCNFSQENKIDVVFYDDSTLNDDVERIELTEDKYLAVFPKSYCQPDKVIDKDKLYNYSFVLPKDSTVKNYFDLSKFAEIFEVDSDDDSLIIQMVKEGMGVTVLPALTLKNRTAGIKVAKLTPEIKRTLCLAFLKDNKKVKSINKFVSYLKEEIKTINLK